MFMLPTSFDRGLDGGFVRESKLGQKTKSSFGAVKMIFIFHGNNI